MKQTRIVSCCMPTLLWILILILVPSIPNANGFMVSKPLKQITHRHTTATDTAFLTDKTIVSIHHASCTLVDKPIPSSRRFWRNSRRGDYHFCYNYSQVQLPQNASSTSNYNDSKTTTAILLIHPIGVGIARWYYNRLLQSLYYRNSSKQNIVVLAPDLLACGSASDPIVSVNGTPQIPRKLPLLNVTDWSLQLEQLMVAFEETLTAEVDWCIVSNGGCVPIALEIGKHFIESQHAYKGNLTTIVLSAPPRLSGLLQASPLPQKVEKSYRILSGIVGRVFWSFALRRNGKFIQRFSEVNLCANPDNLGAEWTPICVNMCSKFPKSRYSTFAFLAGALQQSCRPALQALKNSSVSVNVIVGGDRRKNPARR